MTHPTAAQPQLIYEDEAVFVVNKPPGMHSVALKGAGGDSLAGWLLERWPELSQAAPRPGDAGLVSRLDHMTSGLLLGARTRLFWDSLRSPQSAQAVRKVYYTLLDGHFENTRRICTYIGSPYRRSHKIRVYEKDPGKKAHALPAESLFVPAGYAAHEDVSLVRVEVVQARRHQIRAHAGYVDYPLLGDSQYGSERSLERVLTAHLVPPACPEFFLHSRTLAFVHPRSQVAMSFQAQWPDWIVLDSLFTVSKTRED